MRTERPVPEVLDVEFLPTTGGETLVKYVLSELGTVFELTHGIYGQVFDFSDGGSIVYTEEGTIVSLHKDNNLSIYEDGQVEDIPGNVINNTAGYFYKVVMRALRGNEDFEDEDYWNI